MPHGRAWPSDHGVNGKPSNSASSYRVARGRSGFRMGNPRRPVVPANVSTKASATSLALSNLRAIVILVVVAFHSALAYLGSLNVTAYPFDDAPFKWRAFPIIDSHRWFGFDIFCAWQDVYLMSFMFFLSALFTWPSLARKGSGAFLADRLLRLGLPFLFAIIVVVPLAEYPTYRVTAADPGVMAYARHYLALPFLPDGPMWFLWQLLVLTVLASALYRSVPRWIEFLGRVSTSAGARPGRYFVGLAIAATLAYVPLAVAFTPWSWSESGPLSIQFSRPLLYTVLYVAGLGVGAFGLERGLLASDGMLPRRWPRCLAAALCSFVAWMGLTALAMRYPNVPLALQIVVDSIFALACVSGCFFVIAACLRFGTVRSPILENLANNAFAIYLLHYVFVVWLQYALLNVPLFAVAKGTIVFAGALSFSWATATILRFLPFGPLLIGEARQGPPSGLATVGRHLPAPELARQ